MTAVVEAIPALLHISVFLFFAGLFDFLIDLTPDIGYMVLGIISTFAGLFFEEAQYCPLSGNYYHLRSTRLGKSSLQSVWRYIYLSHCKPLTC